MNTTRTFRGFSLIEIVLALGIMSFALASLLGLFPLALETAKESKSETRITFIAQSILSDIRSTQFETVGPPPDSAIIKSASIFTGISPNDLDTDSAFQPITLNSDASLFLAYDRNGQSTGNPLSASDFTNGVPGAVYIVRVTSQFNTAAHPNLTHIEVRVEYPGAAAEVNRKSYRFVSLL